MTTVKKLGSKSRRSFEDKLSDLVEEYGIHSYVIGIVSSWNSSPEEGDSMKVHYNLGGCRSCSLQAFGTILNSLEKNDLQRILKSLRSADLLEAGFKTDTMIQ